MAIGALGIGSGMDFESLVTDLVSAQRDSKKASFDKKIEDLSVRLSAIGSSGSAVLSFNDAVKKLNDPNLFNKRKAEINQPESGDAIKITTNSDALSGQYKFDVLQLAQGSRTELLSGIYQSADDVITDNGGKLNFTAGKDTFTVEVKAGTTLSELASLISKAKNNFGVTTSLIDTGLGDVRLIIMSDKMGNGNDLFITSQDDMPVEQIQEEAKLADKKLEETKLKEPTTEVNKYDDILGLDSLEDEIITTNPEVEKSVDEEGVEASADLDQIGSTSNSLTSLTKNLVTTEMARDGIITIEGTQIQSKNNNFDKAIRGLKIEALQETKAPLTAQVSYDTESVKEAVGTLVESYNKMITTFNDYTGLNGTLQGNSLIRGLESSLVNTLSKSFAGTGEFTTLFDVGIKLDRGGELTLDDAKLDKAIASGFNNFADMFTGDQGIATAFQGTLSPYIGADGLFRTTQDSIQEQISSSEEDLESFEYRMEQYENGLRKKYTKLDSSLAEMNANGDYLRNQLSTLNK